MLPLNFEFTSLTDSQPKIYQLNLIGNQEYAVYFNSEQPLFSIKRSNGKWYQSISDHVAPFLVEQMGEELDYLDQLEFEFPLVYEGEGVLCKVAIGESGFAVLINNKLIAELNMMDDGIGWEVTNGTLLDLEALTEIGYQIEQHMKKG